MVDDGAIFIVSTWFPNELLLEKFCALVLFLAVSHAVYFNVSSLINIFCDSLIES